MSVNLPGYMDSAGRFPGSALIEVMDSFDPGVKQWFVAPAMAAGIEDHIWSCEEIADLLD